MNYKIKLQANYEQVQHALIDDHNISDSALRLLLTMMRYPKHFNYNKLMLNTKMGWGKNKFQKVWNELQQQGYLVKRCYSNGTSFVYEYDLYPYRDNQQPTARESLSHAINSHDPKIRCPESHDMEMKAHSNTIESKTISNSKTINNNTIKNKTIGNNNTVSSNNNIDKKEKNVKKEKSEYDTSQCPFVKQPEPIKYYDINTLKRLNNRRLVQQEIQKCIKDDNKNTEFYLQLIDLIKNMEVDHASSTNEPVREYQH